MGAGPAGAKSGLHADPDHFNLLYQLYGNKTVTLFPLSESNKLYEGTKSDYGALVSQVDPFDVNLSAFPKFVEAKREIVHITAGDILYVPHQWYHFAEIDSASISISGRIWTLCSIAEFVPVLVKIFLFECGVLGTDTTTPFGFF